jgi:hypothetical protein
VHRARRNGEDEVMTSAKVIAIAQKAAKAPSSLTMAEIKSLAASVLARSKR